MAGQDKYPNAINRLVSKDKESLFTQSQGHSHTEKDKNTLKLRRCTYVPAFLMIMGFEYSYLLFLRCQIAICEGIFLKAFFERSVIQFGMLFHSFIPIREKELFCISSLELLTYNFPQVNDGVWYE